MKMFFISMTLLLAMNAQASDVILHCAAGETLKSCADKSEVALQSLGCQLDSDKTECTFALEADPKNPDGRIETNSPYCEISSLNCSKPSLGNFGGENCFDRNKISIPRKFGVDNGYWFGLFGSVSRTVCISK